MSSSNNKTTLTQVSNVPQIESKDITKKDNPPVVSNADRPGGTSSPTLKNDDFVLAGLTLEATKQKAIETLGQPINMEDFTVPYIAGGKNVKFTKYNFAGVSVIIEPKQDSVWDIRITDTKNKTIRGVSNGDSITKVKELYGKEFSAQTLKSGNVYYSYKRNAYLLAFEVDGNNKVVAISIDKWSD